MRADCYKDDVSFFVNLEILIRWPTSFLDNNREKLSVKQLYKNGRIFHFLRKGANGHCNLETGRNNPHKPKVCGRKRKTQVFSDELRNLIFITCIKYVLSDSRGTVWFMIKKKHVSLCQETEH
ncbi:uncharacterized protein LOC105737448 [Apis florea]|uniref:uncharacterized protein LOC105737448 n=1 Tax=Apis florea TaxID=7463 RepID=UPI000629449A|nr:uncharacterized protein LOC105737448 [Apis florea]